MNLFADYPEIVDTLNGLWEQYREQGYPVAGNRAFMRFCPLLNEILVGNRGFDDCMVSL